MFRGNRDEETICALSTANGTGALALVRLSGPQALPIARQTAGFLPENPRSHQSYFGRLTTVGTDVEYDEALVAYFAPGKSFTGEETLEFSTHGSSVIVEELLKNLIRAGAKAAERGEFTYRAFMHGKLDLVQAESVLALIESQSLLGAKQALRQLKGGLSEELEVFESEITWSLAHIEAGIDFSTEGLETVSSADLLQRLSLVESGLAKWLSTYRQGRLLREGLRVVLMGRPNVGKSSLLNVIVNEEKAIVTDVAGTTRDLIEAPLAVEGVRINFIDTAGLRDSDDIVEKIGIARTQKASQEADLILFVFDLEHELGPEEIQALGRLEPSRVFLIGNKIDRAGSVADVKARTLEKLQKSGLGDFERVLFVSALDKIQARETVLFSVAEWIRQNRIEDQGLLFQARHFERLTSALGNLQEGLRLVREGLSPELAAIELKEALLCVQETLGKHFDDQILDRVFKEFCIGK